ncbi:unnamed protein product, partial [Heterosigma akashiwo]
MVTKVLRSLNELKSVGPDGVSPRLLEHCVKELARPLTDLFQKVTRAAEFPRVGGWRGSHLSTKKTRWQALKTIGL